MERGVGEYNNSIEHSLCFGDYPTTARKPCCQINKVNFSNRRKCAGRVPGDPLYEGVEGLRLKAASRAEYHWFCRLCQSVNPTESNGCCTLPGLMEKASRPGHPDYNGLPLVVYYRQST